jgi:hypothetical protein
MHSSVRSSQISRRISSIADSGADGLEQRVVAEVGGGRTTGKQTAVVA